jgi:hypothetical protein
MNAHTHLSARDNSLVQTLTATILSHGSTKSAPLIAGERYGWESLSVRALLASTVAGGGALIPTDLAVAEVIDSLRPLTVVRKHTPPANVLVMPFGNLSTAARTPYGLEPAPFLLSLTRTDFS